MDKTFIKIPKSIYSPNASNQMGTFKKVESKFYVAILILMLLEIICISFAISLFTNSAVISNFGRIQVNIRGQIIYKSEIRGVFIHMATLATNYNWTLIAETLAPYKIDSVYIEYMQGPVLYGGLANIIQAFHLEGIEVYVSINVLGDVAYNDTTKIENRYGEKYDWNCPTNPVFRSLMHDAIIDLVSNYDIDGIMLDYIRYDLATHCYCQHCRAAFEEWLGEGPITDWTPFYPDGSRWLEYAEWRITPVTELVRLIRQWAHAVKPNLPISVASWSYFSNIPNYWRKWIGQDVGDWIRQGLIDMDAPMMYTNSLTELRDMIQSNLNYKGGAESVIPIVAFLAPREAGTPESFKEQVNLVRQLGLDGWILWRYSGPGGNLSEVGQPDPDIRDFLSAIDLPDTFSLSDISVQVNGETATISWKTNLPATSKVEYNISPLFNASWGIWNGFNYWNITHTQGIIIEVSANVTTHLITLNDLKPSTKYYFRIQSRGISGTATSKTLTFITP